MDGLSAAASIIAVIQISTDVIKLVNSAAGATKERKRLREEIRSCEYILEELRDDADDSEEGKAWSETVEALEASGAPLGRLWAALNTVREELEPSTGLKKTLTSLKWPFKEKEVEKMIGAIEREKGLLEIAMSNNTRKLVSDIKKTAKENHKELLELISTIQHTSKESQDRLEAISDDVARVHSLQASAKDEGKRSAIIDWLTKIDYESQQNDFIERRQPGTGQWLLDSNEYRTWLQNPQKTLFCPGIPGAGKTMLTAIVIDDLIEKSARDLSTGIAYLYCNFRRQGEQKLYDMLASLLKQLSQTKSSLPESVRILYDKYEHTKTRPRLDEVVKTLQSVATSYSKVYILIDALDECSTSDNCRKRFLNEIFTVQAISGANIFATSRYIPEVAERFAESIRREVLATKEDVRLYVNGHMSGLPTFVDNSPDLREEIKYKITQSVEGMFLLAQLHLDSLVGKRSAKALRNALTKLPKGSNAYDESYRIAMERIHGQLSDQVELAKQVLLWITHAKRPLSPEELRHALAVEIGQPVLDQDNMPEIGTMLSVTAGLVTIDSESDIIRLVHYTTQEYFERTQKSWFPLGESDITECCITYLSFDTFHAGRCESYGDIEERLRSNPLYGYAASYWGEHARNLATSHWTVESFLQDSPKVEAAGQAISRGDIHIPGSTRFSSKKMTGLHLAAFFGLEHIISALIQDWPDVDAPDGWEETPLHVASRRGCEGIVKQLIASGKVDVNVQNWNNCTPLHFAASDGDETIVQMLIAAGADVNFHGQDSDAPLHRAAEKGHEDIVRQLIATGRADVNIRGEDGYTPLHCAAVCGHKEILQQLIATGKADFTVQDRFGCTPLQIAVESRHEDIVQQLIATGKVDVKNGGSCRATPLSTAIYQQSNVIVQLLLSTGQFDFDLKDKDGNTVSLCAASFEDEAIMQQLKAVAHVSPRS